MEQVGGEGGLDHRALLGAEVARHRWHRQRLAQLRGGGGLPRAVDGEYRSRQRPTQPRRRRRGSRSGSGRARRTRRREHGGTVAQLPGSRRADRRASPGGLDCAEDSPGQPPLRKRVQEACLKPVLGLRERGRELLEARAPASPAGSVGGRRPVARQESTVRWGKARVGAAGGVRAEPFYVAFLRWRMMRVKAAAVSWARTVNAPLSGRRSPLSSSP